jgi:hypothetical protein
MLAAPLALALNFIIAIKTSWDCLCGQYSEYKEMQPSSRKRKVDKFSDRSKPFVETAGGWLIAAYPFYIIQPQPCNKRKKQTNRS